MSSFDRITVGALAVVPGPGQTVTFVRQERGPYAGWWLLPGGKTDFGESLEETARREAAEEAGCRVGPLRLTGAYEMRVTWARGDYHLLMFAFRAEGVAAAPPDGFYGHHVAGVRQDRPSRVRTHPTVMRILRDAGVADHPQAEIDAALAREGITMTSYPVGAGTLVR